MVTFATGSVAEMACNWVKNVQNAGVQEVLIGALDEAMMSACATAGAPCELIRGGNLSAQLLALLVKKIGADA